MKYAFMIMGPYSSGKDDVRFSSSEETRMIGVKDIEEACSAAVRLKNEGYTAIELCGAFGEAGARRIIEATGHEIAIGFVTHFPEDDALFQATFG